MPANPAQPNSITYIQIPAADTRASAAFYEAVFGWKTSGSGAHVSFEDPNGHIIGAFIAGRAVAGEAGVFPFIYVAAIDETIETIRKRGGEIVRERYDEGDLWVATFRDPAGNVIGVWQMRG